MLESVGFVTIEAENGKEAVDRARQLKPAAVLMDIRMPVMDGYQAVRLIKDDPALKAVKVFALTASAFRHDEELIRAAGFDGFLAKPFKQGALFALLRDKTDIQLVYESAPLTDQSMPIDPESLDYRALSKLFAVEELESIERWALINDFSAVSAFSEQLRKRSPELAGLLMRYASSFDEEGLSLLVKKLGVTDGRA
jgi:CheY-like chemotaxis protein